MELSFATVAVTVERPTSGIDPYGELSGAWETETVKGVLFQPGTSSDLDADRPEGTRVDATFHFPKGYARPLKGCRVLHLGRAWRVIGDPAGYVPENTPGGFGLPVPVEVVDG